VTPASCWHLGSSLGRVFAGYLAALVIGVALGLAIGRSKWAEDTLLPPLEVLRPIPAVAWIPLAILMFPSSELSMVFITFTGALFPILLNTVHGVEGVDPRLMASARSLGRRALGDPARSGAAGRAPSIVTGLAIGMGTSWFCLVTAEMISGQFGIGYYTWESYTLQNYPDIVVGMLLIGVLGMGSSLLIKRLGGCSRPGIDHEERLMSVINSRPGVSIFAACRFAWAMGVTRSKRCRRWTLPSPRASSCASSGRPVAASPRCSARWPGTCSRRRRPIAGGRARCLARRRNGAWCSSTTPCCRGARARQRGLRPEDARQGKAERHQAAEMLQLVGLADFAERWPSHCPAVCSNAWRSPGC
jgi:NitT/TauT family transport system permease protein